MVAYSILCLYRDVFKPSETVRARLERTETRFVRSSIPERPAGRTDASRDALLLLLLRLPLTSTTVRWSPLNIWVPFYAENRASRRLIDFVGREKRLVEPVTDPPRTKCREPPVELLCISLEEWGPVQWPRGAVQQAAVAAR